MSKWLSKNTFDNKIVARNNVIRVCNLRRNGYRIRKIEWGIERLRESELWNSIFLFTEEYIYIYIYI